MSRVLYFLVALLVLSAVAIASSQTVTFERERIKVFVEESAIRVEGTYYFSTSSPTNHAQGLYYPFPHDSLHPFPSVILVRSEGDTLSHRRVQDGVAFTVRLRPDGPTVLEVFYEQLCLDGSACYILTSTSMWRRPLERADFEIYIPSDLELRSMTYTADETIQNDDGEIHRFTRTQFQPERDLCLHWRQRKPATER